jgi:hypothetical protein
MPNPKASDWEKHEELLDAGTRGWNPLQRLPRMLEENFEWAKEFVFGFFHGDDVHEAGSFGWAHVRTEHFDVTNFNTAVGTRFGLIDDAGVVKWRDNYLMMMPKDFRRRQLDKRHEEYQSGAASALEGAAYAHPSDPRYDEMLKASRELSEGESYRVKVRGEPQQDKE